MSKILVVEDDSDILSIIEEKLVILGFEIRSCNGEEDIVEVFLEFEPEVVLLDIMLPKKDGVEIAKDLKKLPEAQNTPIIAVSGNPDIGDTELYLEAGFADTCPKPIDYTDLMMKIARALGPK